MAGFLVAGAFTVIGIVYYQSRDQEEVEGNVVVDIARPAIMEANVRDPGADIENQRNSDAVVVDVARPAIGAPNRGCSFSYNKSVFCCVGGSTVLIAGLVFFTIVYSGLNPPPSNGCTTVTSNAISPYSKSYPSASPVACPTPTPPLNVTNNSFSEYISLERLMELETKAVALNSTNLR